MKSGTGTSSHLSQTLASSPAMSPRALLQPCPFASQHTVDSSWNAPHPVCWVSVFPAPQSLRISPRAPGKSGTISYIVCQILQKARPVLVSRMLCSLLNRPKAVSSHRPPRREGTSCPEAAPASLPRPAGAEQPPDPGPLCCPRAGPFLHLGPSGLCPAVAYWASSVLFLYFLFEEQELEFRSPCPSWMCLGHYDPRLSARLGLGTRF